MKFVDGPEGVLAAKELLPDERRQLLSAAIATWPPAREFKLAQIYDGWGGVGRGEKANLGTAFRRLVREGLFPMIEDLGDEDHQNHARYRRVPQRP